VKWLFIILCTGCLQNTASAQPSRRIEIRFSAGFANQVLQLGETAKNSLGEDLTVERFRFYVSQLSVIDLQNKQTILPVSYHLVDMADTASCRIRITIPNQPVKMIAFVLGVDSARNVSGIQTGDLDPARGMFWTWNSGYIMAKLEGTSPKASTAGHRFTHHIGGFKSGMNTIRTIRLPLTDPNTAQISVYADLNHWFAGAHSLSITQYPVCHSPGSLAVQFADNYQNLFSIR
jgi:hypothetical protein